MNKYNTEVLSQ